MLPRILLALALLTGHALAQGSYNTPDFTAVLLDTDPTLPNHAVRKSYLDTRLGALGFPSGTALALAGGGTGATDANGARVNLGITSVWIAANCNAFTAALPGCVPASGGGTTAFLRADGTWALPPSGGGGAVSSVAGKTGAVTLVAADVSGDLSAASNLSDLANAATARVNLGLGGAAVLNVGTAANTVAAGNDARLAGALQVGGGVMTGTLTLAADPSVPLQAATKQYVDAHAGGGGAVSSVAGKTGVVTLTAADVSGDLSAALNLSDLASVATARVNLGLGGAAVLNVGTAANTVAAGNDARLAGALQVGGGVMTGTLTLAADPAAALQAATKQYVDAHSGGGSNLNPISNTYTANNSVIDPTSTLVILNGSSGIATSLNAAADTHGIAINNQGPQSTLQLVLNGRTQVLTLNPGDVVNVAYEASLAVPTYIRIN